VGRVLEVRLGDLPPPTGCVSLARALVSHPPSYPTCSALVIGTLFHSCQQMPVLCQETHSLTVSFTVTVLSSYNLCYIQLSLAQG
jgi:hypothetical protein